MFQNGGDLPEFGYPNIASSSAPPWTPSRRSKLHKVDRRTWPPASSHGEAPVPSFPQKQVVKLSPSRTPRARTLSDLDTNTLSPMDHLVFDPVATSGEANYLDLKPIIESLLDVDVVQYGPSTVVKGPNEVLRKALDEEAASRNADDGHDGTHSPPF
ncbi:hypothetical protein K438DRAFT_1981453 [Mycena galopus ATCC 62051]|nr:hypothetical protein K438DRAFT_1981453 [Mycena galopus ATCC 62051]